MANRKVSYLFMFELYMMFFYNFVYFLAFITLVAVSLCVGLVALLHFFALVCALAKNANVLPIALAYASLFEFVLNFLPVINPI